MKTRSEIIRNLEDWCKRNVREEGRMYLKGCRDTACTILRENPSNWKLMWEK